MSLKETILKQQKSEITEHNIYKKLSRKAKNPHNKKILEEISADELKHHDFWKNITKQEVKPNYFKIRLYTFLASIFGLSFALQLMERGEEDATELYKELAKDYPAAMSIREDELKHEQKVLKLLEDERLEYASSIVLGLNDALVELTGTLTGLTFALGNGKIIGITGLIMGVAASLSMAGSEYLSSREDEEKKDSKNPIKSAIYTGIAYILTVLTLVTPFFMFANVYSALLTMLGLVLLIILAYTFYMSIAKNMRFKKKFLEMAAISLGVAIISFAFGWFIRTFVGVEV